MTQNNDVNNNLTRSGLITVTAISHLQTHYITLTIEMCQRQ